MTYFKFEVVKWTLPKDRASFIISLLRLRLASAVAAV
jgi:hypothetical protein